MKKLIVGVAGSTQHTVMCAEALVKSTDFEIAWVLTPIPKELGRKKVLTANPLDAFAAGKNIPRIHVTKKINTTVAEEIRAMNAKNPIDVLLVVDFGYLIPEWLLELPKAAPLNVHPSALPAWRGSSPGQFVLLSGARESAITLMVMDKGMDTGPVIYQKNFSVGADWTQTEYYHKSFELMAHELAAKIVAFVEDKKFTAQSQTSPTPTARRLQRDDGFIEWQTIVEITDKKDTVSAGNTSSLLQDVAIKNGWPLTVERAARALAPWPTLWTVVPTAQGEKRMQIVKIGEAGIQKVKVEGQREASWNQVKNKITRLENRYGSGSSRHSF